MILALFFLAMTRVAAPTTAVLPAPVWTELSAVRHADRRGVGACGVCDVKTTMTQCELAWAERETMPRTAHEAATAAKNEGGSTKSRMCRRGGLVRSRHEAHTLPTCIQKIVP